MMTVVSSQNTPPAAQKDKVGMRFFPGSYPGVYVGQYPNPYPGGYFGGVPAQPYPRIMGSPLGYPIGRYPIGSGYPVGGYPVGGYPVMPGPVYPGIPVYYNNRNPGGR